MDSVPPVETRSTRTRNARKARDGTGIAVPCTVVWYGEEGELARTAFPDENSANIHVIGMLQINMLVGDVVGVEIRQPDGKILSSHYGPRPQGREAAPSPVTVEGEELAKMPMEAA